jgi:hypothetical protein
METTKTEEQTPMQAEPQKEHEWLKRLVGKWTYEGEATGPDGTMQSSGTETIRSLGDLWIVAEGTTQMDDIPASTLMTLGFDPQKKQFVGTWLGSTMTKLWVYDGWLEGNTLTLEAEGPSFESPEKTAKYRDIIEIVNEGHRLFRSQIQTADGSWQQFMSTDYRRSG